MAYQHISFDLWGTLIQSNPAYSTKRNNLISDVFGITVLKSSFAAAKMLADEVGETTGEQVSLAMLLSFAMTDSKDRDQVRSNGNFLGKVREFQMLNDKLVLEHPPMLYQESYEVLKELHNKGVAMSILSNTSVIPGYLLKIVLEKAGVDKWFKFMLFSDEIGVCKPISHPYTQVRVQGTPAKPIKILHVGDNPYADQTYLFDCYIIGPDKPITKILNLV